MAWVNVGQLVDTFRWPPCQGHYRASRAVSWHNHHQQPWCCFFCYDTHTHTHAHKKKQKQPRSTLSIFIYLKSMSCSQVSLWGLLDARASLRHTSACWVFFFSLSPPHSLLVHMCMCGHVVGAAIIITLVDTHMSTYWSRYQWAARYLALQRASWICLDFLLRPHSEISLSSAKDHPPGKIIGSYTPSLAAINASLITDSKQTRDAFKGRGKYVYFVSHGGEKKS